MTILFSAREEVIRHWQDALVEENAKVCRSEKELFVLIQQSQKETIVLLESRQYEDIGAFLSLMHEDYAHVKIVLCSNKPSYIEGFSMLPLGIRAYVNTYMAHVHIQDMLKAVKSGNIWLYPEFIQKMIEELAQPKKPLHVKTSILDKLSERERQIALLVKEGLSNKEIAFKTEITERTVKAHLSAIFEKIGVRDRLSLALML